jgi:O-glycosyl hydrolase
MEGQSGQKGKDHFESAVTADGIVLIVAAAIVVALCSTSRVTTAIPATSTFPRRATAKPCSAPTICIDGSGTGRVFEGVGGLSAGATSRFLIDYPEPYKSQILDYLFKPYYGASLQHLKVEIGGDTNSTWGSEPSHMHSRHEQNFNRGYEWWLMQEARKRNPQIFIDILPWGAPGWIGNHHFYSQDMIDYDLEFINAAHDIYGVDVNYVGIWNETRYDKAWIKSLNEAVVRNNAAHKLDTRIVAADEWLDPWHIADDMSADPGLLAAVDVIGAHYPKQYTSPAEARNLTRDHSYVPLWDSEDAYLVHPGPQAANMAKMLNRAYIAGKMTKLVHCTTVTGFPAFIKDREGLLETASPWSGHYAVEPSLWATAHTTQFVQPGWQYIDSASGYLQAAGRKVVGSYVTLKAPNNSDYSIIIETSDATADRPFTFAVMNGLSTGAVHVWHSNLKAGTYFLQEPDLPGGGSYSITLQPASIYSLTTTTGQQKGNAGTPPADSAFPFPFSNNFENDTLDKPPKYFVDEEGSFEVASCSGRPGKCMVQMVDQPPIEWGGGLNTRFPFTFLGDQIGSQTWTDYEVSVDVLMEEVGSVTLWGHLDHLLPCLEEKQSCWGILRVPDGYSLTVDSDGGWLMNNSSDKGARVTRIKSGYVPGWQPKTWHNLKMAFGGSALSVLIDGKPVMTNFLESGRNHAHGMVALGTEWNKVQFDNFCVGTACP